MQLVLFCGIQATGKSTFYQQRFFHTHVRLSPDLLRTRHRDPTHADADAERATYLAPAKVASFEVVQLGDPLPTGVSAKSV